MAATLSSHRSDDAAYEAWLASFPDPERKLADIVKQIPLGMHMTRPEESPIQWAESRTSSGGAFVVRVVVALRAINNKGVATIILYDTNSTSSVPR